MHDFNFVDDQPDVLPFSTFWEKQIQLMYCICCSRNKQHDMGENNMPEGMRAGGK